jgi:hypothetical protein
MTYGPIFRRALPLLALKATLIIAYSLLLAEACGLAESLGRYRFEDQQHPPASFFFFT